MKKIISLLAFMVLILGVSKAGSHLPFLFKPEPGASLQKFWVEYDVTENGIYGMRIHADITIYELKGTEVYFGIYFKKNDGDPASYLRDKNGRFSSRSGQVSVGKWLTPSYESSVFEDVQIFMPYDELDLDAGEHELTMQVDVVRNEGGTIAWLKLHDFTYTQYDNTRGGSTKNSAKLRSIGAQDPRAEFEKIWIDHNISFEGEKGMMIHLRFSCHNMKGMEAYVAVYFMYNDANKTLLKSSNDSYASSDGYVAAYKLIKPDFSPVTYYEDLRIFMPVSELEITNPGKHDLLMDAKVIYKEGGLISNLGFYSLYYTL